MSIAYSTATRWAHGAFAATLVLGLVLITGEAYRTRLTPFFSVTSTTTKTTTERKTTTTGTETVERSEVTTAPNQNLPERMMGQGGLWLVRILLVLLGAFLAGAAVQRTLLGNFAFKAGGLEVPPLPALETAALDEIPPELAAAFEVDASQAASPGYSQQAIVSSSYVMALLSGIQDEGAADYVVIDLGAGDSWLTTRLFIFAILLRRMRSLRAFVFVESTSGIEDKYLGVKSSEAVRWLLAREYSWLEPAFARAYAQAPDLTVHSESGALDPSVAENVVAQFLESVQVLGPPPNSEWVQVSLGTSEHARWIDRALSERLFNLNPLRSSVADHEHLASSQRTAAILACDGPFVALVDKSRRFKTLVDRDALLERAVRLVSAFDFQRQ